MTSPHDPWTAPHREDRQFSIAGLLALMTVVCVALAPARYVRPSVFAGIIGAVAVLTMAVISRLRLPSAIAYLAWWCLLVLYVIAAIVAAWEMPAETDEIGRL